MGGSENGARLRLFESHKPVEPSVLNDLDVAYAEMPETERDACHERADRAPEAAGMPDWICIAPMVTTCRYRP